jgi:cell division protein FtsW (lipid II flippase)
MEKLLQMVMFFAWGLWLLYCYIILFSRKAKPDRNLFIVTLAALVLLIILLKSRVMLLISVITLLTILPFILRQSTHQGPGEAHDLSTESHTPFHSLIGMVLTTVIISTLAVSLGLDFKSETNYFIEKYTYAFDTLPQEIVIGNSKTDSHITVENDSADRSHLKLLLNKTGFQVQNVSSTKKVDVNGRYLDKLVLAEGDEIEINGKEKIRLIKIGKQYPLGRSIRISIAGTGKKNETLTLHTLLNKQYIVSYSPVSGVSTGLNKLLLPSRLEKPIASISYETNRFFMGVNIYYIIVLLTVLLLSAGIYLYLRNRFNGALLLLLMVSLPFMAGVVSLLMQIFIMLVFIPFIYFTREKRSGWNWGASLLTLLFTALLALPYMLRMDGDFTFRYYDYSRKDSIKITRNGATFLLKDTKKTLDYDKTHRVILGHTEYALTVSRKELSLIPVNPEKIRISPRYKAIISDLDLVEAGENYIYLKFPHTFDAIPAARVSAKERLTVGDKSGSSIVLSKITTENYSLYFSGLILGILIPFWVFWLCNYYGLPLGRRYLFRLRLFNRYSVMIYNFVFFMLGLGYVVFGALALYNNSYFKNFEKYRSQALPIFVVSFFLALVLSRYNRWLVFLYRVIIRKKFHVPLVAASIPVLLVNYGKGFLYAGIVFFIFVFFFRLRKDIDYEFKSSRSYPLIIKRVIETPIANFEDKANQRIFFGLGKVLNNKGWNYLLVSDLLLMLALFFIVLQVFLGGELGVPVAGFFFLPIELGKILLTLYFADWVSRIDKGMALNVLWVYGLVLIPFLLLVVFLKDFSPLVVFAFVFLYHIIKIDKSWKFKTGVLAALLLILVLVVTSLSRYSFPYPFFSIAVSLLLALLLLRLWLKRTAGTLDMFKKVTITSVLVFILAVVNYVSFIRVPPAPKTLGSRISAWLEPWQDYDLSYQYVNALWLMKGTGTFGKSSAALTAAANVPLIEKDLSFSLYVSTLGTLGTAFIFLTLFLLAAYVHQLAQTFGSSARGSPSRWYLYMLEFLVVIFLAQFLVPALYAVGLLPIMGQPLPFLSYSNNMLLLFALPFAFLMIVLANNLIATEVTEGTEEKKVSVSSVAKK